MSASTNSTTQSFPLAKIIESLDALGGSDYSVIIHDVIGDAFYKREAKLGDAIEPLERELMKETDNNLYSQTYTQIICLYAEHAESCMRLGFARGIEFALRSMGQL